MNSLPPVGTQKHTSHQGANSSRGRFSMTREIELERVAKVSVGQLDKRRLRTVRTEAP